MPLRLRVFPSAPRARKNGRANPPVERAIDFDDGVGQIRIGRRADLPVYVHFGQLWGLPESGTNGEDVDTILARVLPLLREGDVLAIPSRTPHKFVDVSDPFLYFVVKVEA